MKPYALDDLASDLLTTAFDLLRTGGRLVFFLPVVTEEYEEVQLPRHPGMLLIANSVQSFGRWERRVRLFSQIEH